MNYYKIFPLLFVFLILSGCQPKAYKPVKSFCVFLEDSSSQRNIIFNPCSRIPANFF